MDGNDDLVARRLRFIERRKRAHADAVLVKGGDVKFAGLKPRGSGAANRHGMPAVPVGQHTVTNWPVLDLGHTPKIELADWRLEIGGLVENPVSLTWSDFLALPQVEDVSDFHCVTSWSRLDNRWKGVRFSTLAELAVPKEHARFVVTTGRDQAPGTDVSYTTNLALERAMEPDVLLVHEWEGQPLPREHGGPCRMITPKLYAWKGAKWIHRIDFMEDNWRGFWEVRGYSDTAEPWFNDRYSDS